MEKKGIIALVIIGVLAAAFITWTAVGIIYGEELLEEEDVEDINIAGSTTCLPVISAIAEHFEDRMEDKEDEIWDISVGGGGSSVGVKQAGQALVDIGMASRDLKSSEESAYPDLVKTKFALDGIAIIVGNEGGVWDGLDLNLTESDIANIYKAESGYTNWNDIDSSYPDVDIFLIGRDSNSGTRASFEELLGIEGECDSSMQELNSNGAVLSTVEGSNGAAIGYVGLGYADEDNDDIKIVQVSDDGIEYIAPSIATVKDGTYPISRSLYLLTLGDPSEDDTIEEFIDYVLSSTGQAYVAEEGFVPL
ncbi:MAG: phosphate ABC transporter substrate-binding protein [Promethearchaeota archaeon]|nr:MAG: phosphate ABC transporter substrate-binding protein [Candidatus Lokiarchaeota archaeon]